MRSFARKSPKWGKFDPLLAGLVNYPYRVAGLQAAYDFTDSSSLAVDASNRVSYAADKSGNSAVMGLVLPGTSGNYASTPDSAAISVTGDIDLRIFAAAVTWTPAAIQRLICKRSAASAYDWYLNINGTLECLFTGGFGNTTVTSSVATGLSAFAASWLRVTRAQATGVCTFYTSSDGSAWTQLGTTVTGTSGTLNDTTDALTIGIFGNTTSNPFAGTIYRAQIYNGIAGTLVFDANFSAQARGTLSFNESSVNAALVTITPAAIDLPARICGARDLAQLTGSKQPTLLPWSGTNYAWLPGASGNYGSTPSAVANQITGDLDIVAYVASTVWVSASAAQYICGKWQNAGQRSYRFDVTNATTLNFINSTDGTANSTNATSDATVPFTNGQGGWVRVTWAAATGATIFYTSTQALSVGAANVTWVKLGSTIAGTIGTTKAGTDPLEVGTIVGGTNSPFSGAIYYVELRNGIGAAAAVKFDASQAVHNATSWVSSTGETWSLAQSGAKPVQIVGRQTMLFDGTSWYMKAPPFALNQPTTVVLVGKQNTWGGNLTLFDGNGTGFSTIAQSTATPGLAVYPGAAITSVNNDLAIRQLGVIEAIINSGTSSIRINRLTAQTGGSGTTNPGGVTIGADHAGSGATAIQASRVFIYSVALTTSDLDRIALWASKLDLVPNV